MAAASQEPVPNTLHNVIQTLSVKIDSAARYPTYGEDARREGCTQCEELYDRIAATEAQMIQELTAHLRSHLDKPPTARPSGH
jgi:rubrerythrin